MNKPMSREQYKQYLTEQMLAAVIAAEKTKEGFIISVHRMSDVVALSRQLVELSYDFPEADKVHVELLSIH